MPKPYADVDEIVQYWEFYNYDAFDHFVVSQWHQSDWEQVTVGVAGGKPRFVGYSSHCFGTWLPWTRAQVSGGTHPVVWVAKGTHANYPRRISAPLRGGRCPGFNPPKYLGVAGLAFGLVEAGGSIEVPADVGAGLTDETGDDPARPVRAVLPKSSEGLDFAGKWGRDNRIAAFRAKQWKGTGPDSPTRHPEWEHPGAAILCNRKWFAPRAAKPTKASCARLD